MKDTNASTRRKAGSTLSDSLPETKTERDVALQTTAPSKDFQNVNQSQLHNVHGYPAHFSSKGDCTEFDGCLGQFSTNNADPKVYLFLTV